jgi:hypothetical protein
MVKVNRMAVARAPSRRLSVRWARDDGSKPVLRSQAPPKGPIGPLLTFTLEWTAPSETSVSSILKIKDPIATTAVTRNGARRNYDWLIHVSASQSRGRARARRPLPASPAGEDGDL